MCPIDVLWRFLKAYHKQYDDLKKKKKDAEILYLRCKNVPPELKLESDVDLKPLPQI